MSLWLWVL